MGLDSSWVSGGIFLSVLVLPFCGYKLWKKLKGKCCQGPFHFPSSLTFGGNGGREGNFLRRRLKPRVELDFFGEELRVGERYSFKVFFPLCRHRHIQIVQDSPQAQPSLQESVFLEEEYSLDKLDIRISKVSQSEGLSFSSSLCPSVTPIKELLPRSNGANANEDTVLVTFMVQESGFYEISIFYEDSHVEGPFPVPFNPTFVCGEKSVCLRETPIAISIIEDDFTFYIKPKDRYGNECNYGDVDTCLFSLKLYQDFDKRSETVDLICTTFQKEIVRVRDTDDANCDFRDCVQVRMTTEVFQPGIYRAILSYSGSILESGLFTVVTLTPGEFSEIKWMLGLSSGKYQEASLIRIGEEEKKEKEVFLYFNTKTMMVKEFFLAGLFPYKIATFRIFPATQMKVCCCSSPTKPAKEPPTNFYLLEISDRTQPPITLKMAEKAGRISIAMFSLYLKNRLGGSESFENKQKFFYEELKASKDLNLRVSQTILKIERNDIINSTLSETRTFSGKDWCRKFKISFVGEEGSDDGGLRREWLNLICRELFESNPTGLFYSMGNSRLVHPNPRRDLSKWTLKHYELAGRVVGKCLFETAIGGFSKQMVNARFSRSFLGQVIGFNPQYKHFEQDDPDLYLRKVKYILDTDDLSSMDLTFTEEEYSSSGELLKVVDLVPNGSKIPVTNENRESYLNHLAQYRLCSRIKKEIEAFNKGLVEIVPEGLLSNFDENELEILMCGQTKFEVSDLKSHHTLSGEGLFYQTMLPWFWTAINNFTEEEKGRLLQFVTGSSLLPHNGFKELLPTFRITVYDDLSLMGKLPIAHTCFNEICLAPHRTFEDFEKALKTAVNEGSEGFGLL